jgi:thiol-disulfide isomerase/thioredoxin
MRLIKIAALLLTMSFVSTAQEATTGIHFEHSTWKEILAKAKAENKLVMLDAYTSWCGPCKWMAKNIFTDAEVGKFYNASFVNAKIDMEKGEGVDIAKTYNVRAYPTLLYVNGDGQVMHRVCGAGDAASFIADGKVALDNKANYAFLKKNFEADPKANAKAYFEAAEKACDNVSAELNTYLKTLSAEEAVNADNFGMVYSMLDDYSNPAFPFFYSNYSNYGKKYGSDTIDFKLRSIYEDAMAAANYHHDDKKLAEIKSSYAIVKNPKVKEYLNDAALFYAIDKEKKPNEYYAAQANFIDKHVTSNPDKLNSYAWNYYENVNDKKLLERAAVWAEKALALEADSYAINDTYAALLYKIGKKAEAKKAAEKAIEIGKKSGQDYKETEELLKKIAAMK